ncbi:MAG: hemolysin III family protein [Ruminococcaceae bacterium]|nr:hemolysin III family protein [Oscillospiraceae bacterium]
MLPTVSFKEELVNSITHGLGAVLGIGGTAVAIVWAALYGDAFSVVSASIYGAMLIILYVMSTLYHAFTNKTAKKVFRIFDHCSIFLLIAGTYTPFTLCALRGAFGWTIFGIIWGMTVLGIVFNAISIEKFKIFSMVCYLVMGWLIIIAFKPLMDAIGFIPGTLLLLLGGISYTVGIIFFALKKIPYMHGIWHIFVLLGSVLHYFSVLFSALPVR